MMIGPATLPFEVRPRLIFYFSFAALVSQGRFTTLVLKDFGLDDEMIGTALSVGILAGVAMTPWWTRMADKFGALPILKLILMGHATSVLLYAFVPYLPQNARVYLAVFVRIVSMGFIQCLSPVADAYALRRLSGDRSLYGRERSWGSLSWGARLLLKRRCSCAGGS